MLSVLAALALLALAACGSGARGPVSGLPVELRALVPFPQDTAASRQVSQGPLQLPGRSTFLRSAQGAADNGLSLELTSSGNQLAWAIWRFTPGSGADLQDLLLDVASNGNGQLYPGLANYSTNRWNWLAPLTAGQQLDLSSDNLSANGNFYVALVAVPGAGQGAQTVTSLTLNYGGGLTYYTLSGTITDQGNPLPDVTVLLSGAAQDAVQTDANGQYQFVNLLPGQYSLLPVMNDVLFTPPQRDVTIVNQSLSQLDFAVQEIGQTYSISGRIALANDTPVAGIDVLLTGAVTDSVQTDANGNFTFNDVPNGNYTLTPSGATYTFAPPEREFLVQDADVTGQDFTATQQGAGFAIRGRVTDTQAQGKANVTVNLSGPVNSSVQTDQQGNYEFLSLPDGAYTVAPSTPPTYSPPSLPVNVNGADVANINFQESGPPPPF